jgi:hypothetical protein
MLRKLFDDNTLKIELTERILNTEETDKILHRDTTESREAMEMMEVADNTEKSDSYER